MRRRGSGVAVIGAPLTRSLLKLADPD